MKSLVLISLLLSLKAYGTSTGDTACTFTTDTSVGTQTWTNPSNAATQNTTYATTSINAQTSHYLLSSGCSFSLPSGSTINGITVKVRRDSSSSPTGCIDDSSVRLFKAGSAVGDNKAVGTPGGTCSIDQTDTTITYGGTSDLWGTTWTEAEVEAAGFGVGYSMVEFDGEAETGRVDLMTIAVEYTVPPPGLHRMFLVFP